MKRNYRYCYGTRPERNFPKMSIQPPLFATIEDAYMHFVRHPEERQIFEDAGDEFTFSALDDVFDRMEFSNYRINQIVTDANKDQQQQQQSSQSGANEGNAEGGDVTENFPNGACEETGSLRN